MVFIFTKVRRRRIGLRIIPWKFIPNFLQLFHFFSKKLLGFRGKVGNLEVYFLKSHARFPCPVKE